MAHSGPDGAGTGSGRVYPRTPDHGHPVRGLHRRLERSRPLLTPALRDAWGAYHHLCDVLALLSVYLPPGTLHRAFGPRPEAQGDPNWGYGGGRRCDRQPGRLLRHAGSVPGGISLAGLDIFALIVAMASFVVLQRFKVPSGRVA